MKTVKLYRINIWQAEIDIREVGEHVSLYPFDGYGSHGEDDGGKDYILPDGYFIGKDCFDIKHIYNKNDYQCFLGLMNNTVVMYDGDKREPIFLKRA